VEKEGSLEKKEKEKAPRPPHRRVPSFIILIKGKHDYRNPAFTPAREKGRRRRPP